MKRDDKVERNTKRGMGNHGYKIKYFKGVQQFFPSDEQIDVGPITLTGEREMKYIDRDKESHIQTDQLER